MDLGTPLWGVQEIERLRRQSQTIIAQSDKVRLQRCIILLDAGTSMPRT